MSVHAIVNIDLLNDKSTVTVERGESFGTFSAGSNGIELTLSSSDIVRDIAVSKSYVGPILDNTWFHVFVRQPDGGLVGGDMYTSIFLNSPSSSQENLWAEFNVNGDEQWVVENGKCAPKANDDTFHIGIASDNRYHITHDKDSFFWTNDVPIWAPIESKYSDWRLYSAKYFVPEDGVPRWRLYVNGQEIIYRDTGYKYPEGHFQNVITLKPRSGDNTVRFRFSILGDGNLYKASSGRVCESQKSPFTINLSGISELKAARVQWGGLMIGRAGVGDFDLNTVKSFIYAGKLLTSAAVATDMISWREAEFNCAYVSYNEIAFIRKIQPSASTFCRARVLNDIYAGYITTSKAILSRIIDWQSAQFNCPYMSEDEKKSVRDEASLNAGDFCKQ